MPAHPVVRDMTAGRSLIGARWRAALSPVRMSWATGLRRTHAGPHVVERTWRWPGGDQGCTGDQADTGLTTLPDTAAGRGLRSERTMRRRGARTAGPSARLSSISTRSKGAGLPCVRPPSDA
jgi:hypothetical protein